MFERMGFYTLVLCILYCGVTTPEAAAGIGDGTVGRVIGNNSLDFIADEDPSALPQTEEMDEIEEELKRLMEDVKRLEKVIKKRIQEEVVPHIKREIEKLRKWLQELLQEEDDASPQKTRKDNRNSTAVFQL